MNLGINGMGTRTSAAGFILWGCRDGPSALHSFPSSHPKGSLRAIWETAVFTVFDKPELSTVKPPIDLEHPALINIHSSDLCHKHALRETDEEWRSAAPSGWKPLRQEGSVA